MSRCPILISIHLNNEKLASEIVARLKIQQNQSVDQELDELINEGRILAMKERKMQQVRPGMGDTGRQVFGPEGLQNVHIEQFIKDMYEMDYKAISASWQKRPVKDRQTGLYLDREKRVINLYFAIPKDIEGKRLDDSFLKEYRAFAAEGAWQHCHVWANDRTETIVLTGGCDRKAKRYKSLRFGEEECAFDQIEPPPKTPT